MLPHHAQGFAHYLARCCFVAVKRDHLAVACWDHLIGCLDFLGFLCQRRRCLGCHFFDFGFLRVSWFRFRSFENRWFDHHCFLNLPHRWSSRCLGLRCCRFLFHYRWNCLHCRMSRSHFARTFDLPCLAHFPLDHSVDRMLVHL